MATDTENPDGRSSALIEMTGKQRSMCRGLDTLHRWGGLTPDTGGHQQRMPTDMFGGALFASREEWEGNPDWIAQAAHSLREILHPFHARSSPKDRDKAKALGLVPEDKRRLYRAALESASLLEETDSLWRHLNGFAHHHRREEGLPHTRDGFVGLLRLFEGVMTRVPPAWGERHPHLDKIAATGPGNPRAKGGEKP